LDTQVAIDVKQNFKESVVLRRRFTELAADMIESNRKAQVSKAAYDNPNWSFVQADRAGYERALRDMVELFSE
jgi:hypothetical protein